jgi:hypothetical protein
MLGSKNTVSVRTYKIATFSLAILAGWLACKYLSLYGQVMTGGFVSHQAVPLRAEIRDASEGGVYSKDAGAKSDRDMVLIDLNWYLNYYDHRTNELVHSPVLGLLQTERDYVVRDAIVYLRKTGTNDFGDDPYEWLKHEYRH